MPVNKTISINPPGFVPMFGQGLQAKESQLAAVGTKEWLKDIKLHKYWPLVSHWSYWEMMGLTADNIGYHISKVGGSGITRGAQGKLLRSVQDLRTRERRLYSLTEDIACSKISVDSALSYIEDVAVTPMPISQDEPLPTLLVHTLLQVMEFCNTTGTSPRTHKKMERILLQIRNNPVLSRAEVRLRERLSPKHLPSFSKDSNFAGDTSKAWSAPRHVTRGTDRNVSVHSTRINDRQTDIRFSKNTPEFKGTNYDKVEQLICDMIGYMLNQNVYHH